MTLNPDKTNFGVVRGSRTAQLLGLVYGFYSQYSTDIDIFNVKLAVSSTKDTICVVLGIVSLREFVF